MAEERRRRSIGDSRHVPAQMISRQCQPTAVSRINVARPQATLRTSSNLFAVPIPPA